MRRFSQQRVVPYGAEQMFDLAVDVERYGEFLPGWSEASIRRRGEGDLEVDQVLGFAGMRIAFTSRARFLRPRRLCISAEPGMFRSLEIRWEFIDLDGAGSRIELETEFELRSRLLERAAAGFFAVAATELLPRFEDRARQLFDGR